MRAIDDRIRVKSDAGLNTALRRDVPPKARERLAELDAAEERAEKALVDGEKELPTRQVAWERELQSKANGLPRSLAQGLVAFYPFDSVADRQFASGIPGEPPGKYDGPDSLQLTPGVLGHGLYMTDAGSYQGPKVLDLKADRAFSYGCWFQYDAKIPMILLSTRKLDLGSRGFDVSLEEDHQLRMALVGEEPDLPRQKRQPYSPYEICVISRRSVNPAVAPGWHHVMVVYDGSKKARGVEIYVDGQAGATRIIHDAYRGTIQSDSPLWLGSRNGTYRFQGAMNDVRVYNRRLSADDVRKLYEAGLRSLASVPAANGSAPQRATLAAAFRPLDKRALELQRELAAARQSLAECERDHLRGWWINSQEQTMVIAPGPVEFTMGSPRGEGGRREDETQHQVRIDRTFALSASAVTLEQYRKFDGTKERRAWDQRYSRARYLPAIAVTWYDAAKYCNWLSKEEGAHPCYEITDGNVKLKENYLHLDGYRLPTEAEVEFAIRAARLRAGAMGSQKSCFHATHGFTRTRSSNHGPSEH